MEYCFSCAKSVESTSTSTGQSRDESSVNVTQEDVLRLEQHTHCVATNYNIIKAISGDLVIKGGVKSLNQIAFIHHDNHTSQRGLCSGKAQHVSTIYMYLVNSYIHVCHFTGAWHDVSACCVHVSACGDTNTRCKNEGGQ